MNHHNSHEDSNNRSFNINNNSLNMVTDDPRSPDPVGIRSDQRSSQFGLGGSSVRIRRRTRKLMNDTAQLDPDIPEVSDLPESENDYGFFRKVSKEHVDTPINKRNVIDKVTTFSEKESNDGK